MGMVCTGFSQVTVTVDTSGGGCFGSVNLLATSQGAMGTNSYSINPIPYAPEAYAGSPITLFDDDVSPALPIGFNFCFLGQTYTQFYIGSNGWISFSPGQTTAYTATPIPDTNPAVPKNAVMGPWEDWNPGIGGTVMFQTIGTAPNRKLVVSWLSVPMFSCTSSYGTFQLVLHETTSLIENHLTDKPNCIGWANGQGTQGLHNDAGTLAFTDPNRNSTQWTAFNESTAFVPDGIVWYLNGSIVGQGNSLSVPAGSTGTYVAQVTLCDGTIESDSINVSNTGFIANALSQDALCAGDSSGLAYLDLGGANPNNYTYQWNDANAQTTDSAWNLLAGTYTVIVTGTNCSDTLTTTVGEPTAITGTYNATDACDSTATGWAIVAATGGAGGYQYSLDNGLTYQTSDTLSTLTPGTYDVLITDAAGCSTILPITIGNQFAPTIDSVSTTDPSCLASDGTITIHATGNGTLIYAVNGNPSTNNVFTNLGVGTYTITVANALGCISTTTVTLSNPLAPVISNIITFDPSCGLNDGQILVSATGANPPLEYSFDGGGSFGFASTMTGLAPGTYQVVVLDASGCQATQTVTLLPNDIPVIDSVTVMHPECVGDSGYVTIYASGGFAPLFYSLEGGATDFQTNTFTTGSGAFIATVTGSNACATDLAFTVNAPDTVVASFNALPSSGVDPLIVDFVNTSTGGTNYYWDFGDGTTSNSFDTSHVYTPKGDYPVTLIVTNGNCSDTASTVINVYGTASLFVPNVFSPNGDGYNDVWQPTLNGISAVQVHIYDNWGVLVTSWNILNGFWDGGNHPDGTYFYTITATSVDGTVYQENGSFIMFNN